MDRIARWLRRAESSSCFRA